MLDKMRKPTRTRSFKKYFYVFLFAIIISTFIFMGSGSGPLGGGAAGGVAAIVNDKVITYKEFSRAYSNEEQRIMTQAKGLPDALRKQYTQGLAGRVLENLVQLELAKQLAVKSGVTVSSAEVRDEISSMASFQEDGRFQASRYQQLLTANRLSTADFEESVRAGIAFERVRNIFSKSLSVTSGDMELEKFAKGQKLNVDFLEISRAKLKTSVKISKEELVAFEKSKSKEIKTYYDGHQSEFTSKDKVKVRHILIKTKSPTDEDYKVALDKITGIKAQINKTNFAELAKKFSEDTGSQVKGGDLGEVDEDVGFVAPFKEAVFSLPVGKVSDPVKTSFGYHLIEVTAKTPGGTKTLEQASGDIAKTLLTDEKVDKAMASMSSEDGGFNSKSVEEIKSKYGLKWQNTGDFTVEQSSVPKIGSTDKVWQTLAEMNKNETKMIETDGKYYVVKFKSLSFNASKEKGSKDDVEMMERLSQYRSGSAVQAWVDLKAKTARIRRNVDLERYR